MKKYGIDKLTTSVRIYRKDWEKVAELAMQRGYNMADAAHEFFQSGTKVVEKRPCNEAIPELIIEGDKIVGLVKKVEDVKVFRIYCDWCLGLHEPGVHSKPPPEIDLDGHIIP